mmetsp:Transcript_61137/g.171031  ORF Transcript_61137/g.171031 Transcript_61137/m.171031 type:complete len:224 (-) Transcript_61137:1529-2200(-)
MLAVRLRNDDPATGVRVDELPQNLAANHGRGAAEALELGDAHDVANVHGHAFYLAVDAGAIINESGAASLFVVARRQRERNHLLRVDGFDESHAVSVRDIYPTTSVRACKPCTNLSPNHGRSTSEACELLDSHYIAQVDNHALDLAVRRVGVVDTIASTGFPEIARLLLKRNKLGGLNRLDPRHAVRLRDHDPTTRVWTYQLAADLSADNSRGAAKALELGEC